MKKTLFLLAVAVLLPLSLFALTNDETQIVNTIKGIHTFVVVVGELVCLIGLANGAIKLGAGDENGKRIITFALIAAVILLLSKPIFNTLIGKGKSAQVNTQEIDSAFR